MSSGNVREGGVYHTESAAISGKNARLLNHFERALKRAMLLKKSPNARCVVEKYVSIKMTSSFNQLNPKGSTKLTPNRSGNCRYIEYPKRPIPQNKSA